ncbi:hypothetical protein RRG08_003346, partial [Elysia crispata]
RRLGFIQSREEGEKNSVSLKRRGLPGSVTRPGLRCLPGLGRGVGGDWGRSGPLGSRSTGWVGYLA